MSKSMMMALALALASTGVAYADGDGGDGGGGGGDNSMSQWTGDSYAAFHRGEVGDFYTDPNEIAGSEQPLDESRTELASWSNARVAGASAFNAQPGNPFRDDTAA